jgi:Ni/Co efflux regulator RcnB
MKKILIVGLSLAMLAAPAMAQSQQELNYMRDSARAQERQADEMRHMRQIESDRALREDRAQRNYERDSRSSRRFDHR